MCWMHQTNKQKKFHTTPLLTVPIHTPPPLFLILLSATTFQSRYCYNKQQQALLMHSHIV